MLGTAPDRTLQVIALFFAGFGFAPAMSTLYVAASRAVQAHAAPEVFGWLTTASLAGGASGTAVAGVTNDAFGTAGSFATATLLALVAATSPVLATLTGPMPELSA